MRTFLRDIALFCALQCAIAGALLVTYYHDEHEWVPAVALKDARLRSAPHPRLIVVGGSGANFGIDSEMLARDLPYQPVNMGFNAGLSYDWMLEEVEPHIAAGDLVVLTPEPHLLMAPVGYAYPMFWEVEQLPSRARLLHLSDVPSLLDNVHHFAAERLRSATEVAASHLHLLPEEKRFYAINAYGDEVGHDGLESRLKSAPGVIAFDEPSAARVVARINDFNALCLRRGATAVFFHSPLPEPYVERNRAFFDSEDSLLKKRLTVPILNSQSEVSYPLSSFYDTMHHLTGTAKKQRTADMVRAIQAWLASPERRRSADAL